MKLEKFIKVSNIIKYISGSLLAISIANASEDHSNNVPRNENQGHGRKNVSRNRNQRLNLRHIPRNRNQRLGLRNEDQRQEHIPEIDIADIVESFSQNRSGGTEITEIQESEQLKSVIYGEILDSELSILCRHHLEEIVSTIKQQATEIGILEILKEKIDCIENQIKRLTTLFYQNKLQHNAINLRYVLDQLRYLVTLYELEKKVEDLLINDRNDQNLQKIKNRIEKLKSLVGVHNPHDHQVIVDPNEIIFEISSIEGEINMAAEQEKGKNKQRNIDQKKVKSRENEKSFPAENIQDKSETIEYKNSKTPSENEDLLIIEIKNK